MNIKRKTSKYYIHKEINLLLIKLIRIKHLYSIFRKIYFKDECEFIYKTIPKTSTMILQIIVDTIILELSCLVVDYKDEDLCINGFINKYHKYEGDYKEKRYIYIKDVDTGKKHRFYIKTNDIKNDIDELEKYINKNEHIRKFLKKYRDKTISHNDKRINFKPHYKYTEMKLNITYDELEEYIDKLFFLMNNIYSTLYKTNFAYVSEVDQELDYLNDKLAKE